MNYRDKQVLVFDNGLFLEIARRLAKDFGKVLYYAPWTTGYPRSNMLRIGQGVKEVIRVADPWEHIDDTDLFVFPDCYEAGLQEYLAGKGKRVWGCRNGAELELDRVKSKELCADLGIDIGPYQQIVGLGALRKHLQKHKNQFVKISATRGDMETFSAPSYEEVEPRLDELEHNLGAKKKIMEFIVEDGISPAIESGYDGYTIDGKFAKNAIVGVEVKDKAYVGRTMRYSDMPKQIQYVNDRLSTALKRYGYRGFISTEVRCTPDGKAYLIDPCSRAGSPPSELYQEMIGNLADIIWHGSEGTLVEPEYTAKWGAEVLLLSDWADKNWQQVTFPREVRDNLKLRNFTVIDGEHYVIPQSTGMPEIGAVVALGDTPKEAIEECKRIAAKIDGYSIEKPLVALDEAFSDLREMLQDRSYVEHLTPAQKKAQQLYRDGKISQRQYDKAIGG